MYKFAIKLIALVALTGVALTGFTYVMADAGNVKISAAMDHSGMDHSKMDKKNPEMKKNTMQHNMEGHDGKSATMQNKPVDKSGAASAEFVLITFPASGKAREAGSDGSYMMKQTNFDSNIETKCALASRGIIMLDRRSWNKCAVQPSSGANK